MKYPRKVEKQNKGFSLVEVLVTLAVISILSIPIIRSFVNSARTNKNARNIQNATDVAQSVSEYFDAMSLDSLKTAYSSYYVQLDNGMLLFKNIGDGMNTDSNGISYYKGSDKERFYVSVLMDTTVFDGDGDNPGSNQYIKPDIHNLNENSSVTCRGKLDQYDRNIVKAFENKGIVISSGNMYKIKKKTVFKITEKQSSNYKNSDGSFKIEYRYSMDIYYTYEGAVVEYTNIDLGIGILDKAQIKAPNLYIIYTPTFAMYGTETLCQDEIEILYMAGSSSPEAWEKPVNVYLVQQEAKNKNNFDVYLNKENITVQCYYGIGGSYWIGSFDNTSNGNFNLFTNIDGWDAGSSLTVGDKNLNKLYTVSVYVWKDNADGMSFDSEGDLVINSDYYTVVTNVKEE